MHYLLVFATLLPLVSFFLILAFGPWMGKAGRAASYVATTAIGAAAVLSFIAMFGFWLPKYSGDIRRVAQASHHGGHGADGGDHETHEGASNSDPDQAAGLRPGHEAPLRYESGTLYSLGSFGQLKMEIGYYIDSLTVAMFCMVTLIATLIHCYAMGYMHDELHDITDHEVTLGTGEHLHRSGRYHRFFQYLSLFCFSMLGLVLSGNIAMVFVFWELVGICSYFLIGFYVERKSASTAANKAFIVNRVGDFGFIIGLMVLWSTLGTFTFGDTFDDSGNVVERGIFSLVRSEENEHRLEVPEGMVLAAAEGKVREIVMEHLRQGSEAGSPDAELGLTNARSEVASQARDWKAQGYGYGLLFLAGVGIFCGCVGKSAQFPLHVWLPDAMEGPTPVSALVHSATMVAAGVYLVGRFFPVFCPEVLLVIAVSGCITLFMAATIAITATDIKRVLAYSTVSQLGYMMLALGVGGWVAGLMHLITHAFFKSLLFMCSGSVIHAVHTNEMPEMGGLWKKMPVTAVTMLIGCLAIAGVNVFIVGFSGHYSKDAILEQALSFMGSNGSLLGAVFFCAACGGAGVTAFYMFRMWYMTFLGKPRNQERYDHAHESPQVMYVPLIILSVFAVTIAWGTGSVGEVLVGSGIAIAISLLVIARNPAAGEEGGPGHAVGHGAAVDGHATQATHGHGDHGHDGHGHDGHGHDGHGHDGHGHDGHGHGGLSPNLVYLPLVLSVGVLLLGLTWRSAFGHVVLQNLLEHARPVGTLDTTKARWLAMTWPNEHDSHAANIKVFVTLLATGVALAGIGLATVMYALGWMSPEDVRRQFSPLHRFLLKKWWFDELYDGLFVQPTHLVSRVVAGFDKNWIDRAIDGTAHMTRWFANQWDAYIDRVAVDGVVNVFAGWTYSFGLALRGVQTGRLRQYVMFIVLGAIAVFVLLSLFAGPTAVSKVP